MAYKDVASGGEGLAWINENLVGKEITNSRSPAGNWLGLTIEHIEFGKAIINVLVKHDMTNPYGNIHGGMMSLVIDESIGWAIASLDTQNHYTSLSLNVDFLYAIKEGQRIRAIAQVLRKGKKIINVECHVYDLDGKILARGNGNLIVTNMEFAH